MTHPHVQVCPDCAGVTALHTVAGVEVLFCVECGRTLGGKYMATEGSA